MELFCVAKVLQGYRLIRLLDVCPQKSSSTGVHQPQNLEIEEQQCADGVCSLNGWKPEKH